MPSAAVVGRRNMPTSCMYCMYWDWLSKQRRFLICSCNHVIGVGVSCLFTVKTGVRRVNYELKCVIIVKMNSSGCSRFARLCHTCSVVLGAWCLVLGTFAFPKLVLRCSAPTHMTFWYFARDVLPSVVARKFRCIAPVLPGKWNWKMNSV